MNTFAIIRATAWASAMDLERSAGVAARVLQENTSGQVRWLRSYVTDHQDGRLGMICIYEASSLEALSEHSRRAGLPVTAIYPVRTTVVINDDTPAAA